MTHSDLVEIVAALKHDLGKYSSWISANLEDCEWRSPLSDRCVDALRRDLLCTRTHRDGSPESAWEVWARVSAPLPRPLPAPELTLVERAVDELKAAEVALRAADRVALAELSGALRGAQQTIRRELLRLHRRLRAGDRDAALG
ncbi:MAG TPA: hypothetical protein ENJ18_05380 [Nannocystis exedens]|nr:hypothetical protein [Nannocystis exedens]